MKTKLFSSMICLMLAFVMLLSAVSCKTEQTDDPSQDSNNGVDGTSDGTGTVDPNEELYRPEEKNYDRKFMILTSVNTSYYVAREDFESGASVIDDAIFKRAALMEERYGVEITATKDTNVETTVEKLDAVGDYYADIVQVGAKVCFRMAQKGYISNLSNLTNLNLEAPYWDQQIQIDYKVGDKVFLLNGDISYYDELMEQVCVFNDDQYAAQGFYETYGTPYSLVDNGTWTFDTMMTMIKGMYRDLNNSDTMDEYDHYGMLSQASNVPLALVVASGMRVIEADEEEGLVLNIDDSSFWNTYYNVAETILKQSTNNQDIYYSEMMTDDSDIKWDIISNIIANNRALFRFTTLSSVARLGNMASRFGVLPVPNYYEGQDRYYGFIAGNNDAPLFMPRTVTNKEESAKILDTLAYHSRYGSNNLVDAYVESFRIAKFCRTDEDERMLRLVMDNKIYDLDHAATITDIPWEFTKTATGQEDISKLMSNLTTRKEAARQKLADFVLAIMANVN